MMSEVQQRFDTIAESASSLKTLYFRPSGLFTNALVLKPDITQLLRDADSHENALYHVDKQGRPERKDGTHGIVDAVNEEFMNYEAQQLVVMSTADASAAQQQQQQPQAEYLGRLPAVLVPKDISSHPPESSKGVKNLLSRFNEENFVDYDVNVLCDTVNQLLEKYPVDGVEQKLNSYIQKWETLKEQISKHEATLEKQRDQLSSLNVSLHDREHNPTLAIDHRTKTAYDLFAVEEEEIRQLELEIERKSRDYEPLV